MKWLETKWFDKMINSTPANAEEVIRAFITEQEGVADCAQSADPVFDQLFESLQEESVTGFLDTTDSMCESVVDAVASSVEEAVHAFRLDDDEVIHAFTTMAGELITFFIDLL